MNYTGFKSKLQMTKETKLFGQALPCHEPTPYDHQQNTIQSSSFSCNSDGWVGIDAFIHYFLRHFVRIW